jgi:hypothetical protein
MSDELDSLTTPRDTHKSDSMGAEQRNGPRRRLVSERRTLPRRAIVRVRTSKHAKVAYLSYEVSNTSMQVAYMLVIRMAPALCDWGRR